jgi:hypothetical protein
VGKATYQGVSIRVHPCGQDGGKRLEIVLIRAHPLPDVSIREMGFSTGERTLKPRQTGLSGSAWVNRGDYRRRFAFFFAFPTHVSSFRTGCGSDFALGGVICHVASGGSSVRPGILSFMREE